MVGLGKTAQNIHDRNLLKQTIKFINTFNEKSISTQKVEKYKNHLDSNPKYAEEELGGQVAEAARRVTLDTIFTLRGTEE